MKASICIYFAAISLANLIIWASGAWAPLVSLACAFVLVGLDMSIKDALQERWGVSWRLFLVIVGGGAASLLVPGSARICGASVAAFVVSAFVDVAVFAAFVRSPKRYIISNTASALVDSSLFLWLGLGVFGWPVLAQTLSKVLGAAFWMRVSSRPFSRQNPSAEDVHTVTGRDSLLSVS